MIERIVATVLAGIALLGSVLGSTGCATSGVNQGDVNLVSLEDEWKLGDRLARDIAAQVDLVEDRQALAYVNRVGRRIVAQTEMANLPWTFHIVADREVNAFNTPGGHVYVNSGLVLAADDVAEFAGVLSHEIAHGVARHATEQLTQAYGLNILASLALGENPKVYEQILAQVLGGGALASFSRDAEREADTLGVRYMYEAGYDPDGMVRIFEQLLQKRRRQPGTVEKFFATHPLTENRIRAVQQQISGLGPTRGLTSRDEDFRRLQRRLR